MKNTFRDFLNHLRAERNLSPNTIAAYKLDVRRYVDYCLECRIAYPDLISMQLVLKYLEELSDIPLSAASLSRNLSAIRMFHRFMVNEGYSKTDPTDQIDSPRLPKRLPKVLEIHEIVSIFHEIDLEKD